MMLVLAVSGISKTKSGFMSPHSYHNKHEKNVLAFCDVDYHRTVALLDQCDLTTLHMRCVLLIAVFCCIIDLILYFQRL